MDGVERLLGIHAAVEQVGFSPVREEKNVDEPVFEWNRQTELEDARRNLAQSELDGHPGIVLERAKMGSGLYSNVLKMKPVASLEEPMSEVQMTPDQIVEAMPEYLIPEKSATTKATIQFDLSGDGGGKWWVRIHDGKAESGKGDPGEPANLTLLADAHDWVKIMTGQMDATAAFMQGKLKIKGDMGLAIKMQSMFRRPS